MNWPEPIHQAEQLLLTGEAGRALAVLESLRFEDLREQRRLFQLRAQALIHLGDLAGAKSALMTAEKHFGSHISVLTDLACVYHQTGEMWLWRQAYRDLRARYFEVRESLSARRRIQTALTLGKFHEEDGQLNLAEELFREALSLSQKAGLPELYTLSQVQLLRVLAMFSRGQILGELYRDLISLNASEMTYDLWFEWQHSLMLAEIEVVGAQHAYFRLERMLTDPRLTEPDRRLLVFDHLAETWLRRQQPVAEVWQAAQNLASEDAFEIALKMWGQHPDVLALARHLSQFSAELSWSAQLRLLLLAYTEQEAGSFAKEWQNKIHLLLSSLPPESRAYWMKRVKPDIFRDHILLTYDPQRRSLAWQSKVIDLSRRRAILGLIELLSRKGLWDVEDVIQSLWSAPYSLENLHRLRMLTHRLNQVLFEFTAIPRIVEMTSQQLNLSQNVMLTQKALEDVKTLAPHERALEI